MEKGKKVLISWFMKSYGAGFLGNVAIAINEPNEENVYIQDNLFSTWEDKDYELICLTSKSDIKRDIKKYELDDMLEEEDEGGFFLHEEFKAIDNFINWWSDSLNDNVKKVVTELKKDLSKVRMKLGGILLIDLLKGGGPEIDEKDLKKELFKSMHTMEYDIQLKFIDTYYKYFKIEYFDGNQEDLEEVVTYLRVSIIEKMIKKNPLTDYYVNLYNNPSMVQLAWFVLENQASFPKNVKFIHAKRIKERIGSRHNKTKDLPDFCIEEINNPLSIINRSFIDIKDNKIEYKERLEYYLKKEDLFSIIIVGERGIGKSKFVSDFYNEITEANCASFSDDIMAEAELFGYAENAYTGGKSEGDTGLFKEADETGVLFLDEVHHLSERVQAKLMKSLQTDSDGRYKYRRLKGKKEEFAKFQLICATNKSIPQLKSLLLQDFFDRISQRIVEIPSVKNRNTKILQEFKKIWEKMEFKPLRLIEEALEQEISEFLDSITLEGNYRDLQQIAISIHDYLASPMIFSEKSAIEYAKNQYAYRQQTKQNPEEFTPEEKDHKNITKAFQKAFIETLKKSGMTDKEIEKQFNMVTNTRKNWEGK